jgi:hypothetical protein
MGTATSTCVVGQYRLVGPSGSREVLNRLLVFLFATTAVSYVVGDYPSDVLDRLLQSQQLPDESELLANYPTPRAGGTVPRGV